jgi:hypothetical protein
VCTLGIALLSFNGFRVRERAENAADTLGVMALCARSPSRCCRQRNI